MANLYRPAMGVTHRSNHEIKWIIINVAKKDPNTEDYLCVCRTVNEFGDMIEFSFNENELLLLDEDEKPESMDINKLFIGCELLHKTNPDIVWVISSIDLDTKFLTCNYVTKNRTVKYHDFNVLEMINDDPIERSNQMFD